jgi:hypothetical protein
VIRSYSQIVADHVVVYTQGACEFLAEIAEGNRPVSIATFEVTARYSGNAMMRAFVVYVALQMVSSLCLKMVLSILKRICDKPIPSRQ